MTQVTVEAIKQQYPNPATEKTGVSDYCVAGAVAAYYNLQDEVSSFISDRELFPDKQEAISILKQINPKLQFDLASDYAQDIIDYNDFGNFETAWNLVHEALTYNQNNS